MRKFIIYAIFYEFFLQFLYLPTRKMFNVRFYDPQNIKAGIINIYYGRAFLLPVAVVVIASSSSSVNLASRGWFQSGLFSGLGMYTLL